jgi:hypothetical protein
MVPKGRARVEVRLDDLRVVRSPLLSPARGDEYGERSPHPYHCLLAEECRAGGRGGRRSTWHPPSRACIARTTVGGWAYPCMGAGVWARGAWPLSSAGQRAVRGVRAGQAQRHARGTATASGVRFLRGCGVAGFGGAARPPAPPPSPKRGRGRWPRVGPPTTPQARNPAKHPADALPFPHIPS